MLKIQLIFAMLLILLIENAFSQGISAVPFMLINPSPRLNGMGGAYTALPTGDTYGQYFNSAQLANTARHANFSLQLNLKNTIYLPGLQISDIYLSSHAGAIGFSSEKIISGTTTHIGLGYLYTELYLGKNIWTDEKGNQLEVFESKEFYRQIGLGIGLDWNVNIAFGLALKRIHSQLAPMKVGHLSVPDNQATAADLGFLVTAPIFDLVGVSFANSFFASNNLKPFFDISLGYALQNIGSEIKYMDKKQGEPLPRQANLGYAISGGINGKVGGENLKLFKVSWSAEARELLVNRFKNGSWDYVSIPGRMDFYDNVLAGKSDLKIATYQGWGCALFETFEYTYGYFKRSIFRPYTITKGIWISSLGVSKVLSTFVKNRWLNLILSKIEIDYAKTEYVHDPSFKEFEGITFSLRNVF